MFIIRCEIILLEKVLLSYVLWKPETLVLSKDVNEEYLLLKSSLKLLMRNEK